jgi:hypothetical protein
VDAERQAAQMEAAAEKQTRERAEIMRALTSEGLSPLAVAAIKSSDLAEARWEARLQEANPQPTDVAEAISEAEKPCVVQAVSEAIERHLPSGTTGISIEAVGVDLVVGCPLTLTKRWLITRAAQILETLRTESGIESMRLVVVSVGRHRIAAAKMA